MAPPAWDTESRAAHRDWRWRHGILTIAQKLGARNRRFLLGFLFLRQGTRLPHGTLGTEGEATIEDRGVVDARHVRVVGVRGGV